MQMREPASSEEQRIRLDRLVDEASMLSFPASDPPAVFVEEPEAKGKRTSTNDSDLTANTGSGILSERARVKEGGQ
jgi:hypothetical protein